VAPEKSQSDFHNRREPPSGPKKLEWDFDLEKLINKIRSSAKASNGKKGRLSMWQMLRAKDQVS
jgi:hypothetical protein